jgi:hypothetical protein
MRTRSSAAGRGGTRARAPAAWAEPSEVLAADRPARDHWSHVSHERVRSDSARAVRPAG